MGLAEDIRQSPERIFSKKYQRHVWIVGNERRMKEILRHALGEPVFLKTEVDIIKKEKSDNAMELLLAMKDMFPGAIMKKIE